MNNARRKEIARAIALIEEAKAKLEEATSIVADAQSEEEEYRDNMPENLQGSDRYQQADSACDALSDASSELEGFDFDNLIDQLNSASE